MVFENGKRIEFYRQLKSQFELINLIDSQLYRNIYNKSLSPAAPFDFISKFQNRRFMIS